MYCAKCRNNLIDCKCPDFLAKMETLIRSKHIHGPSIERIKAIWKQRREDRKRTLQ